MNASAVRGVQLGLVRPRITTILDGIMTTSAFLQMRGRKRIQDSIQTHRPWIFREKRNGVDPSAEARQREGDPAFLAPVWLRSIRRFDGKLPEA
jgi:hypothetical protein